MNRMIIQTLTHRLLNRQSPDTVDWDLLYADALPRIYNFFRYQVGDDTLAEDLTAATFEKAWRKRDQFRNEQAKFTTWLYQIARNTATDYFRRHKRKQDRMSDLADFEETLLAPDSPAEEVQHLLLFAQLIDAMQQHLTATDQELLALKYGADLNNREIAVVVGLSESNVGTRLSRCIAKLRTVLGKMYEPTTER